MITIAQVQAADRNMNQLQENIRRAVEPPFMEDIGSFSGLLNGISESVSGICYWQTGTTQNSVTMYLPDMTGTSTTTGLSISGLTPNLFPKRTQKCLFAVIDNGTPSIGFAYVNTDGTISFDVDISGTPFTAAGSKGIIRQTFSYVRGI